MTMNIKILNKTMNPVPVVMFVDPTTMAMNRAIVNEVSTEIWWYNLVDRVANGVYYMYGKPIILYQEVSAATAESDSDQEVKTILELEDDQGRLPFNESHLRCWGHSHVNMAVNPSATDNEQLAEYAGCVSDCFVRLIMNKKGDVRFDVADVELGLQFENIPFQYHVGSAYIDEMKAEIKKKVTTKTYNTTRYNSALGYSNSSNTNHKSQKKVKNTKKVDFEKMDDKAWEDWLSGQDEYEDDMVLCGAGM